MKADVASDVAKLCTAMGDGKAMGTTPVLSAFAQELEEAMDPENGIEEEYMPYHDAVGSATVNEE